MPAAPGVSASTPAKRSRLKRVAKDALDYLDYVARYKVGAIVPKAHRPQTIIIVARKKQSSGL